MFNKTDGASNEQIHPTRPFANPEVAARKIMELAHAFEPVKDGRIYIEKISGLVRAQGHASGMLPNVPTEQ